jgi:N-acetylneuraminic acid mutarotase
MAEFQNNIFSFDPSINSWTQLGAVGMLPSGRERMGLTSTPDDLIFMFGGLNGGKIENI